MTAAMTGADDLDARLRSHFQSLVDGFATEAAPVRANANARRRHRRLAPRIAMAAALAIAAPLVAIRLLSGGGAAQVTLHVPGYTIVAEAGAPVTPRLSRERAIAIAKLLNQMANASSAPDQRITGITGLTVTGATFAPGVLRVWSCRAHVYLQHVENIWIVDVTAPAQNGFQAIAGALLVDDDTGNGAGGDLLLSRDGQLPACMTP